MATKTKLRPISRAPKGFAAMDPTVQRQLASKGGRTSQERGKAHRWTKEEASAAGTKGGRLSRGGKGRLKTV